MNHESRMLGLTGQDVKTPGFDVQMRILESAQITETMIRNRLSTLFHPSKGGKVAPLPLPEAIQVEEAEVAAVLEEVRRELEQTTPVTRRHPLPVYDGTAETPILATVVVLDHQAPHR